MKTFSAGLLAIATLPLAACGGSTETTNAAFAENVADDGPANEVGATDDAFGNLTSGNETLSDNAAIDDAGVPGGNGLTAVDNSQ